MSTITTEQFYPTKWVLYGVERQVLAQHLRKLKAKYGRKIARQCLHHGYWLGSIPSNRNRWK